MTRSASSRRPASAARSGKGREGVVLVLVLVFVLLLASSIATFLRRAVIDSTIVSNRDEIAQAEALARGGVRIATAVLIEDRIREELAGDENRLQVETRYDVWARLENAELPVGDDAKLTIRVRDSGRWLNLNALFTDGAAREGPTEAFLAQFFQTVIDEMPGRPEEKLYDRDELARNLIDYIDSDDVKVRGRNEDDYYQRQDPPYRAANRPLLTVDELRLVEGFDSKLVEALKAYVTVFPYGRGDGINPNTAPPWVLSTLYLGVADDFRIANGDLIEGILHTREGGSILCASGGPSNPFCAQDSSLSGQEAFPPLSYRSNVFVVSSAAEVHGIRREVEAVIDRSDVQNPLLLSWRVW